jgi:nucleotide-binding universal stress UspA family protein
MSIFPTIILLATDGSEEAQLAATTAADLEQQVKRIEDAGGTVNNKHLRDGRAAEEIVAVAEEIGAGLIVMGSRGHGRLRRALMGSVSEAVVRHAHCPVTIVRK